MAGTNEFARLERNRQIMQALQGRAGTSGSLYSNKPSIPKGAPAPKKQKDNSFIGRLNPVLKGLEFLAKPGSYVRSQIADLANETRDRGVEGFVASAINPLWSDSGARKDFWNNTGTGTYLQRTLDKNDHPSWMDNQAFKIGAGIVGDVATDPLTYLTGSEVLSGGAAKVSERIAKEGLDNAIAKYGVEEGTRIAEDALGQVAKKGAASISKKTAADLFPDAKVGLRFKLPGTGRVGQKVLPWVDEAKTLPVLPKSVTAPLERLGAIPKNAIRGSKVSAALASKFAGKFPEAREMLLSGDLVDVRSGATLKQAGRLSTSAEASGFRLLADNGFGMTEGTGKTAEEGLRGLHANKVWDDVVMPAMKGDTKAAVRAVELGDEGLIATTPGATELKAFYKEVWRSMHASGMNVNEISDYVPRIVDDAARIEYNIKTPRTSSGTIKQGFEMPRTNLPDEAAGETNWSVRETANRMARQQGLPEYYKEDLNKVTKMYLRGVNKRIAHQVGVNHIVNAGFGEKVGALLPNASRDAANSTLDKLAEASNILIGKVKLYTRSGKAADRAAARAYAIASSKMQNAVLNGNASGDMLDLADEILGVVHGPYGPPTPKRGVEVRTIEEWDAINAEASAAANAAADAEQATRSADLADYGNQISDRMQGFLDELSPKPVASPVDRSGVGGASMGGAPRIQSMGRRGQGTLFAPANDFGSGAGGFIPKKVSPEQLKQTILAADAEDFLASLPDAPAGLGPENDFRPSIDSNDPYVNAEWDRKLAVEKQIDEMPPNPRGNPLILEEQLRYDTLSPKQKQVADLVNQQYDDLMRWQAENGIVRNEQDVYSRLADKINEAQVASGVQIDPNDFLANPEKYAAPLPEATLAEQQSELINLKGQLGQNDPAPGEFVRRGMTNRSGPGRNRMPKNMGPTFNAPDEYFQIGGAGIPPKVGPQFDEVSGVFDLRQALVDSGLTVGKPLTPAQEQIIQEWLVARNAKYASRVQELRGAGGQLDSGAQAKLDEIEGYLKTDQKAIEKLLGQYEVGRAPLATNVAPDPTFVPPSARPQPEAPPVASPSRGAALTDSNVPEYYDQGAGVLDGGINESAMAQGGRTVGPKRSMEQADFERKAFFNDPENPDRQLLDRMEGRSRANTVGSDNFIPETFGAGGGPGGWSGNFLNDVNDVARTEQIKRFDFVNDIASEFNGAMGGKDLEQAVRRIYELGGTRDEAKAFLDGARIAQQGDYTAQQFEKHLATSMAEDVQYGRDTANSAIDELQRLNPEYQAYDSASANMDEATKGRVVGPDSYNDPNIPLTAREADFSALGFQFGAAHRAGGNTNIVREAAKSATGLSQTTTEFLQRGGPEATDYMRNTFGPRFKGWLEGDPEANIGAARFEFTQLVKAAEDAYGEELASAVGRRQSPTYQAQQAGKRLGNKRLANLTKEYDLLNLRPGLTQKQDAMRELEHRVVGKSSAPTNKMPNTKSGVLGEGDDVIPRGSSKIDLFPERMRVEVKVSGAKRPVKSYRGLGLEMGDLRGPSNRTLRRLDKELTAEEALSALDKEGIAATPLEAALKETQSRFKIPEVPDVPSGVINSLAAEADSIDLGKAFTELLDQIDTIGVDNLTIAEKRQLTDYVAKNMENESVKAEKLLKQAEQIGPAQVSDVVQVQSSRADQLQGWLDTMGSKGRETNAQIHAKMDEWYGTDGWVKGKRGSIKARIQSHLDDEKAGIAPVVSDAPEAPIAASTGGGGKKPPRTRKTATGGSPDVPDGTPLPPNHSVSQNIDASVSDTAEGAQMSFNDAMGDANQGTDDLVSDPETIQNLADKEEVLAASPKRKSRAKAPKVAKAKEILIEREQIITDTAELTAAARAAGESEEVIAALNEAAATRAHAKTIEAKLEQLKGWQDAVATREAYTKLPLEQQDQIAADLIAQGRVRFKSNPQFAADRKMVDAYDKFEQVFSSSEGIRQFLSYYDKAMGYLKAWQLATPGFHIRNMMGGIFNNYLAGVDIGAMRTFRRDAALWSEGKLLGEDGAKMAQLMDHLGGGGQYADIGSGGSKLNPLSRDFAPLKLSAKGGESVETSLRGALGWHRMRKGLGIDQAVEDIYKFHFNYTDLSQAERNLKRIIPFYTWTRYNVPLQMEMMLSNPGKYSKYMAVKTNVENQSEGDGVVPNYFVNDLFGIRTPWSQGKNRIYVTPDLPFTGTLNQGLPNIENFDPTKAKSYSGLFDNYMSQVTPFIKLPLELQRDKSFFKNIPLPKDSKKKGQAFGTSNPIGGALSTFVGDSQKTAYILEQLFPAYARARRLFPNEQKYQDRRLTSTASTFGIPLRTNTPDEKKNELMKRSFEKAAAKKASKK